MNKNNGSSTHRDQIEQFARGDNTISTGAIITKTSTTMIQQQPPFSSSLSLLDVHNDAVQKDASSLTTFSSTRSSASPLNKGKSKSWFKNLFSRKKRNAASDSKNEITIKKNTQETKMVGDEFESSPSINRFNIGEERSKLDSFRSTEPYMNSDHFQHSGVKRQIESGDNYSKTGRHTSKVPSSFMCDNKFEIFYNEKDMHSGDNYLTTSRSLFESTNHSTAHNNQQTNGMRYDGSPSENKSSSYSINKDIKDVIYGRGRQREPRIFDLVRSTSKERVRALSEYVNERRCRSRSRSKERSAASNYATSSGVSTSSTAVDHTTADENGDDYRSQRRYMRKNRRRTRSNSIGQSSSSNHAEEEIIVKENFNKDRLPSVRSLSRISSKSKVRDGEIEYKYADIMSSLNDQSKANEFYKNKNRCRGRKPDRDRDRPIMNQPKNNLGQLFEKKFHLGRPPSISTKMNETIPISSSSFNSSQEKGSKRAMSAKGPNSIVNSGSKPQPDDTFDEKMQPGRSPSKSIVKRNRTGSITSSSLDRSHATNFSDRIVGSTISFPTNEAHSSVDSCWNPQAKDDLDDAFDEKIHVGRPLSTATNRNDTVPVRSSSFDRSHSTKVADSIGSTCSLSIKGSNLSVNSSVDPRGRPPSRSRSNNRLSTTTTAIGSSVNHGDAIQVRSRSVDPSNGTNLADKRGYRRSVKGSAPPLNSARKPPSRSRSHNSLSNATYDEQRIRHGSRINISCAAPTRSRSLERSNASKFAEKIGHTCPLSTEGSAPPVKSSTGRDPSGKQPSRLKNPLGKKASGKRMVKKSLRAGETITKNPDGSVTVIAKKQRSDGAIVKTKTKYANIRLARKYGVDV